jgi:ubiquinone/menaquinone biosynthesis C-methylase UbiE
MTTDYNQHVDTFAQTKGSPIKYYSERWTFFEVLKDVRGQSVLDLACGDGDYARAIKQQGADRVVGVDISEKMIERARLLEEQQPLGIEYHVRDVARLERLGTFDVVTAVFLLVYAPTEETLVDMCRVMYANLAPNGRCITVTMSPELSEQQLAEPNQYGTQLKLNGPLRDGATLIITIDTPQGPLEIINYYWSKATYERALRSAGFRTVEWHPMRVSPEGLQRYGAEYWQPYLTHPPIALCECRV